MMGTALIQSVRDGSFIASASQNIIAGLTVGIVSLPLAMGLAIAVGVPPQHGLYTAIIGGAVIAILGGSPVNISGPTAAFVVILLPIVQQYGIGGLLVSGFLAGVIMVGMGYLKLGVFIQTVPYPVVIGFTSGIGTVIAFLQVKDLFGLMPEESGLHFLEKLSGYLLALDTFQWQEALLGISTLVIIFAWKRTSSRIPGYLVALVWGTLVAAAFNSIASLPGVDTIASRFSYSIHDVSGHGIPPMAPSLLLPWNLHGPDGEAIGLSAGLLQSLFGASFAIAILGALESLLCAVVADGMTGEQHDPDSELVGQGIGNMVVPFFGGIPVTAAIARTALNVRSGGSTPLSAIIHSLFLLVAVMSLSPLLSYIPMAAMAAILVAVAWNMSEIGHVAHLIKRAPKSDVAVYMTCYGLTVAIDMQVAVAAGMILAAALFIRRMSELTNTSQVTAHSDHPHANTSENLIIYDVNGPLFFGAAHKALKIITSVDQQVRSVVLDIADVPMIDTTAMINLRSISELLARRNICLYLMHPRQRIEKKLRRFGLGNEETNIHMINDLAEINQAAPEMPDPE